MRSSLVTLLALLLGLAIMRVEASVAKMRRVSDGIQSIVTWDNYSLMINGKRLMVFSGEVHPYRQVSHSLYLDVFQKIKSMGFNAVSFYVFWGMLEPKQGELSFEGFRDLQPFFDAAMKAGIYLIARPGPYINAETTGGGFPGWGVRNTALWRTSNSSYIEAYQNYMKGVLTVIAANQITNNGPVILVQVENEYTLWPAPYTEDFSYESHLLSTFLSNGIKVPTTFNDAWPSDHFTSVDIYGYDGYPNGFDCSHPTVWGADSVPEYFWGSHMSISPASPNAVFEFQGGAFDGWGGSGYSTCATLTGTNFERVFYKNQLAMSTTLMNLYMTYGGTNWGGIAHPGVYTSYDYGSAIAEDRTLRDKYYELKNIASFVKVSPAFLTTVPQNIYNTQGSFTGNQALKTTQTLDVVGNKTGFYTVRQVDASSFATQTYTLNLTTSIGTLTIPNIGGSLTLIGQDSKIHVVDYMAGSTTLLYSTGEIMTWATIDGRDVIVLYGDSGQLHETAIKFPGTVPAVTVVSGTGTIATKNLGSNSLAIQYTTTGQTVVKVGTTALLYLVDRANAEQFWALSPPTSGAFAAFSTANPILVKGGYFMRSVAIADSRLDLKGDLSGPTSFEIIAPAAHTKSATFNGHALKLTATSYGTLTASRTPVVPSVTLPTLSSLEWKTADSLPEIQSTYSDALWTVANLTKTANPVQPSTPVVLYADEYGFHTGNILWRAHFTSQGTETSFEANLWGGAAFGFSMWLDSTFIGSWEGNSPWGTFQSTFSFPTALVAGSAHVITILQDHQGLEEDFEAASDSFKNPRGILSYSFPGSSTTVTTWKVAGNLGGESAVDTARGPLNEGGLFAERQGWHLPGFNDEKWAAGSPTTGLAHAGVSFFRTTFDLHVPEAVDFPIAIVTSNSTTNPHFRSRFYVNGWQFGKYINHIGPQTSFPIPQGVLNYGGKNTLAVSIWAAGSAGAKLNSLDLQFTSKVESSMSKVTNVAMPEWKARPGAF